MPTGKIVVPLSGDYYLGYAKAEIRVNGTLVKTLNVSAVHKNGSWQETTLSASYDLAKPWKVKVAFVNDSYGGIAAKDRNLYVKPPRLGSLTVSGPAGETILWGSGESVEYTLSPAVVQPPPVPAPPPSPPPASTITIPMFGTPYQGNPIAHITVNGVAVPDVPVSATTQAAPQPVKIAAKVGDRIAVNLANDLYGGAPDKDRNLRVVMPDGTVFDCDGGDDIATWVVGSTTPVPAPPPPTPAPPPPTPAPPPPATGWPIGPPPATLGHSITAPDRPDPSAAFSLPLRAVQTLGTIAAGSQDLRCDDASQINQGDQIIVETGAEPGKGLRKSMGVGGQFAPLNNYSYYFGVAHPRSMVARVIGKIGNVLTLDKAAQAGAAVARVFVDNLPLYSAAASGKTNTVLRMPNGTLAFSGDIMVPSGSILEGSGLTGLAWNTRVLAPKGTINCPVRLAQGATARRFTLEHNLALDGYGIGAATSTGNPGEEPPLGIVAWYTSNCRIYDIEVVNAWQMAVGWQQSTGCKGWNIHVRQIAPLIEYIQWAVNSADANGNSFTDVYIDSDWMIAALENFCEYDMKYQRIWIRNGYISTNSSGRYLYEDFQILVEPMKLYADGVRKDANGVLFKGANPIPFPTFGEVIVNVNNNMQTMVPSREYKSGAGGTLRRVFVAQPGPALADGRKWKVLDVQPQCPNVTIEGGNIGP